MDIQFISRLVEIHERADLAELDYAENGYRIRLIREAPTDRFEVAHEPSAVAAEPAATSDRSAGAVAPRSSAASRATVEVTAGLSGAFHDRPSQDAAPFVALGELVAEGQTLAIVEAMKMLNSVEAPVSGKISRVAVAHGDSIEADTVLFVIEPQGKRLV